MSIEVKSLDGIMMIMPGPNSSLDAHTVTDLLDIALKWQNN